MSLNRISKKKRSERESREVSEEGNQNRMIVKDGGETSLVEGGYGIKA